MEIDTSILNINEFENDFDDDFSFDIQKRGQEYYHNGKVLWVSKNKDNEFYAKVNGKNDNQYFVKIIKKGKYDYSYFCTCPCGYTCKHEYAVLMAVQNNEFDNIELLPSIKEVECDIESLIREIPAEKLKEYMLSPIGKDKVCFEMSSFNDYFRSYLPKQSYDYYYNNLYNSILLSNDIELMKNYFDYINSYIVCNDFEDSYIIIKSIVEAYHNTNRLNYNDYLVNYFPKIAMFLRITYRKGSNDLKNEINKWLIYVASKNYYDNLYLEDAIIGIKG